MTEDIKELRKQRLGRYQAAIAMEPTDRVPTAFSTNYFYEKQSKYTMQQIMYDPKIWTQIELDAAKKYPEVDTFRTNQRWAPTYDIMGSIQYKIPGRDLPPNSLHQYIEKEWMKADEYKMFIDNPIEYRLNYYLPRVMGELKDKSSLRSYIAFFKAGAAQVIMRDIMHKKNMRLIKEVGYVPPTQGGFLAPFDYLSDHYRGLYGIMKDMFRQPDNVKEACEALVPIIVNMAKATADPNKQLPIFNATHKPSFLSPKQFDEFYWPTFKKCLMMLIEDGWKIRIFLEGDWSPHWHHLTEIPKGSIICDIDDGVDIFEAKKAFGQKHCITGGIPTEMLILGTPDDIRNRVKELCETVGKDGGWIPNGGGHIPADTKPENYQALLDSVLEYGRYSDGPPPEPKTVSKETKNIDNMKQEVITPWDTVKKEYGWEVPGDEELIKYYWDMFEQMVYRWIMG